MATQAVACCFTGGKDCCLAAHLISALSDGYDSPKASALLLKDPSLRSRLEAFTGYQVVLLVTFGPAGGTSSFKAHPMHLIKLMAKAMGIPHTIIEIGSSEGGSYLQSYRTAIQDLHDQHGIQALLTGDILDVCNDFMGKACQDIMPLLRPLWEIPRKQLLDLLWENNFKAIISCVNIKSLGEIPEQGDSAEGIQQPAALLADESLHEVHIDPVALATKGKGNHHNSNQNEVVPLSCLLLGKELTQKLHCDVLLGSACKALGIDECGEKGEFHTMVISAPSLFGEWSLDIMTSSGGSGNHVRFLQIVREGDFAFLKVPHDAKLVRSILD
ncbi:hypothetical protein CEUSTIGMA_g8095.t1 [Chlamydomonas eustigma]|uniref:Diphthine--ammonia ligase n=1 Tax=Chlamydomonas eustigma TaxID=1157962 RepID=A0A250XD29_9CHLO|nr:hypothetical protein CEUSTIGMA_g8095.t1 [Chlamydomonas eustigma]|eukprot:GAX80660.1 hypothetical protein CEUSTIGMA_g8095.t1 [Chlamydomonas eustigma]